MVVTLVALKRDTRLLNGRGHDVSAEYNATSVKEQERPKACRRILRFLFADSIMYVEISYIIKSQCIWYYKMLCRASGSSVDRAEFSLNLVR